MPTIHGVNASPFVRKVRVFFAEKGLDYELNPVMPFGMTEDFKKLSPLGKIPVYEDGDFALPDSSCIALYIERKHPTPALYPEGDEDFGRALFLEEYSDTKLTEVLTSVFVQRVINKRMNAQGISRAERETVSGRVARTQPDPGGPRYRLPAEAENRLLDMCRDDIQWVQKQLDTTI